VTPEAGTESFAPGSDEVLALFASERRVYVDTATYGLPPRATVTALREALDGWRTGSADWTTEWEPAGEACRLEAAAVLGAPADEIALIPAVSVGVGLVAAALAPEDEIVVPDDEFHSLLLPLLEIAQRRGARVRRVPFPGVADAISPTTTLVATSHVQSNGGRLQDLDAVGEAARAAGARVVVDVSHSAGLLPVDAAARGLHVVVGAAYKHLLCPRGVAFARIDPEEQERLEPLNVSWVSAVPRTYYGGDLGLLATDARRFDVSLAWHPWVGARESLAFLNAIPLEERTSWSVGLATSFAEAMGLPPTGSAVVAVPLRSTEAELRAALAQADVAAALRAGEVRVSFHVYNTPRDVDYVVDVLRRLDG
jgi:selenocysteine lyase/cysteine desulfurase